MRVVNPKEVEILDKSDLIKAIVMSNHLKKMLIGMWNVFNIQRMERNNNELIAEFDRENGIFIDMPKRR